MMLRYGMDMATTRILHIKKQSIGYDTVDALPILKHLSIICYKKSKGDVVRNEKTFPYHLAKGKKWEHKIFPYYGQH